MQVEYVVRNSGELNELEKAIAAFPCLIYPENILVRVDSLNGDKKFTRITPLYSDVEKVIKKNGKNVSLDYFLSETNAPEQNALKIEGDNRTYLINLKKKTGAD